MTNLLAALRPEELSDGDLRLVLSEMADHLYHKVPTFFFRMVSSLTGVDVGQINLRVGSTPHLERYAGHIGYSVGEPFRGRHYAARSLKLLLPLARRLGLDPLWITCDPENAASRRSLELAGAEFVEIVEVPADCGILKYGNRPRKCRYRL
ncbi:MAG TPA: GNAT family N-acetyltransferase [Terracidiphilus sp.]|nr:GNAT family N-acetyltransferase [Terracidiphilus sp.]